MVLISLSLSFVPVVPTAFLAADLSRSIISYSLLLVSFYWSLQLCPRKSRCRIPSEGRGSAGFRSKPHLVRTGSLKSSNWRVGGDFNLQPFTYALTSIQISSNGQNLQPFNSLRHTTQNIRSFGNEFGKRWKLNQPSPNCVASADREATTEPATSAARPPQVVEFPCQLNWFQLWFLYVNKLNKFPSCWIPNV